MSRIRQKQDLNIQSYDEQEKEERSISFKPTWKNQSRQIQAVNSYGSHDQEQLITGRESQVNGTLHKNIEDTKAISDNVVVTKHGRQGSKAPLKDVKNSIKNEPKHNISSDIDLNMDHTLNDKSGLESFYKIKKSNENEVKDKESIIIEEQDEVKQPQQKEMEEEINIDEQKKQLDLEKKNKDEHENQTEHQFVCCGLFGEDQDSDSDDDSPDAKKAKQRRKMNRVDRRPCMIYPEDTWKEKWDLVVSIVLIFTCAITPFRLAFYTDDPIGWQIINNTIDMIFFIDMILIFNTAYYDEDFKMIQHRGVIAFTYFKGWFLIDLMAIFPIGQIQKLMPKPEQETDADGNTNYNSIVRIARIGRMYKLIKLTRLIRIFKIFKSSKGSLFKKAKGKLNLGEGFERLVFFLLMSSMICHIIACMWVFTAQFSHDGHPSWLEATEMSNESVQNRFLIALYFTVTTITTVGYGDISANNPIEQMFCMVIMLIGVIGFSLATSTLTQLLSEYNSSNKKLNEKMEVLKKVYDQYCLPLDLYDRVKKSLTYMFTTDMDELNEFMDVLPQGLKVEVSLFIHEKTYKRIWFLKDQAWSFIAFICPLLKPLLFQEAEVVYRDGDEVNCIFFVKSGDVGNVLPFHNNIKYVDYVEGCHFGVLDIISSCFAHEIKVEKWVDNHDKMKREFTVMSLQISELLTLSVKDLEMMKDDFEDQYQQLFGKAHRRLLRMLKIKSLAIKHYKKHYQNFQDQLREKVKSNQSEEQLGIQNQETMLKELIQVQIQPVDIREIDEEEMEFYTINETVSIDQLLIDMDYGETKEQKIKKKSVFKRTQTEKQEFLEKQYNVLSQVSGGEQNSKNIDKDEIDAISRYMDSKNKRVIQETSEEQTKKLIHLLEKKIDHEVKKQNTIVQRKKTLKQEAINNSLDDELYDDEDEDQQSQRGKVMVDSSLLTTILREIRDLKGNMNQMVEQNERKNDEQAALFNEFYQFKAEVNTKLDDIKKSTTTTR